MAAVTFEIVVFESRLLRDFTNRLGLGVLGDFDIGRELVLGHDFLLERDLALYEQGHRRTKRKW
jgi:hypothetical protein